MSTIIFESPDRCGKDSQIKLLQKYLIDKPTYTLHYSNIKGITSEESKSYSRSLYIDSMFLIGNEHRNYILNRSWIGESVYAPLYRDYDGDYVFDLEKKYINNKTNSFTYLIVLIDEVENLLKRDDGLSHSIDPIMKQKEIDAFKKAFDLSIIKNKLLININNLSIEEVHQKIINFLGIKI